jgi:DNA invertase Pin-like site-specific DNA recombinase
VTSRQNQPLLLAPPKKQRRPGPKNPRYAIPPEYWPDVVRRIEQGESLRQVAKGYQVSYQTVWRIVHVPRQDEEGGGKE